ncbi:THUMP domain-containing protein 3 [Gryllus bimaculatus]|nr:THUMP domain-containing protein 3 [Gryllus bimaculatus]
MLKLLSPNKVQMDLYGLFQVSENLVVLEATVASGLEPLAVSEIKEKVPFISQLCRARGRVFFSTYVEHVQQILLLRSIDHLYLIVSTGKDINLQEKDSALSSVEKLIEFPNWNKVIDIWRSVSKFKGKCFPSKEEYLEASLKETSLKQIVQDLWKEREVIEVTEKQQHVDKESTVCGGHKYKDKRNELKQSIMRKIDRKSMYRNSDQRLEEDKVLKFRMTCYRSGNHCVTSQEVACSLGGKLQEKFNWIVDLVNHDLEAVTNIREDLVYLGISLTPDSLHRRNIINFGPTTLRATVCYNLLRLASPNPGDIILDPLCGGGSIPVEGAMALPGCYNMAGDIHPMAISRAFENIQNMRFERKGYIDLSHWDPFGKRSGSKQNNQNLYQKAMLEMGRCIVPSGRAVCLTWDRANLTRTIRAYGSLWSIVRIATINLGGLQATAYVLKRGSESLDTILEKLQKRKRRK